MVGSSGRMTIPDLGVSFASRSSGKLQREPDTAHLCSDSPLLLSMERTTTKLSDRSSLYSNPLTRASSVTQKSESLITPVDTRFGKTYNRGPSPSGGRSEKTQRSDRASRTASRYEESVVLRSAYRDDVEPFGPYFSLPRDPTANATPARRKTTKDLIGRYESLSTTTSSADRRRKVSPTNSDAKARPASPPPLGKKGKGKSPIRQSFRNLMAVFKKSKGTERSTLDLPPDEKDEAPPIIPRLQIPTMEIQKNHSDQQACMTPTALRSGPLLHLCKDANPNILPVWINCEATLHPHHLLATGETSQGNSSTSMITFNRCTDVRSVNMLELDPTERGLLPGKSDDFKVFELLFEGRSREKFASRSVQDRAYWVNSIWDAVLQNQERKSTFSSTGGSFSPSLQSQAPPEFYYNHCPESSIATTGRRSPSMERELPAIPLVASPPTPSPFRVELRDIPYTPVSSTRSSYLQATSPSRSQSPSIQNLGQRSVVQRRLAEMRHSRTPESTKTERSTRTRQVVSSSNTVAMKEMQSLKMCRTITSESSNAGSFVGPYVANPGRGSPTSTTPSCLPSGGSSMTSPQKQRRPLPNRKTEHLTVEHHRDPFSPSSEYSDEAPQSFATKLLALNEISGLPSNALRITTMSGEAKQPPLHVEGLPPAIEQVPAQKTPPVPRRTSLSPPIQPPRPPSIFSVVKEPKESTVPIIDPETKAVMRNVESSVIRIEGQSRRHGDGLNALRTQVDTVLKNLQQQSVTVNREEPRTGPIVAQCDQSDILKKLEEMRLALTEGLPDLGKRLDELKVERCPPGRSSVISMKNVAPASPGRPEVSSKPEPSYGEDTISQIPDFSELQTKLDSLLVVCQGMQGQQSSRVSEGLESQPDSNPMIQEILELTKTEQAQRSAQAEQQTDSVRYLNELNSWLEAFVNHGTSQIDQVVSGIQQLCRDLGPMSELRDYANNDESRPEDTGHGSLLSDIRRLLIENKGREEDTSLLQSSVNGLIAAVQEDLRRNAESRNAITTESILGLIDRQRQDQERLLRTLASEISDDIRGERLRFVEAMKEATAINVQIHVEEFKKELTREVLLMTHEVGRLQKERQAMEQKIADLFAFYSKQKQSGEVQQLQAPVRQQAQQNTVASPTPSRRPLPSMRRRPLPSPSPRPASSIG